jgi:hypothetical protein
MLNEAVVADKDIQLVERVTGSLPTDAKRAIDGLASRGARDG